jgi:hypothetical protein
VTANALLLTDALGEAAEPTRRRILQLIGSLASVIDRTRDAIRRVLG